MIPIFDSHLDIALNAIDFNRDLCLSVDQIREEEVRLGMIEPGRGTNTLSFPELKNAGVFTCLATLLARKEPQINHHFGHITAASCYGFAHAHLAYYRAMEREGKMRMLRTKEDLRKHELVVSQGAVDSPLGFVLTMEGADPLLTPETLDEFYDEGLRALGLTHYGVNRYGGGTSTDVGLADAAAQLLARASELGMTIDLTHLSDKGFWEVLEQFGGRVHASHQNSRRLANWQRQFSDEMYQAVVDRSGMIGIALDIIMLQEGYVRKQSPRLATLDTVVENIDIVCQLAGSADFVGIGSDLDGGYGCEQTPADLDKISDLQKIPDLLSTRGYSDEAIQQIMHGNWNRFFLDVLPD